MTIYHRCTSQTWQHELIIGGVRVRLNKSDAAYITATENDKKREYRQKFGSLENYVKVQQ